MPDGTILAQPVATATLLGSFADAWRVAPATSLLDSGSQDEKAQIGMANTQTPLGLMQFMHAVTSSANDQIIATGKGEILTGSAAAGMLRQAVIPGITFYGRLATLGSEIITNFSSKDFIDITDFGSGSATLLQPGPTAGTLHVAYGGKSADLTFSGGTIPGRAFQAISDGHGGTLIGYD
jgi:hypothetical protein